MPSLERYRAADLAHEWGAAEISRAAVAHLREAAGVASVLPSPQAQSVEKFAKLLGVGRLIAAR